MNEKAEIDEALAHWPELQDAWQKANTPAAIEESPPIPETRCVAITGGTGSSAFPFWLPWRSARQLTRHDLSIRR